MGLEPDISGFTDRRVSLYTNLTMYISVETIGLEPISIDLQSIALTIFAIFPCVGKAGLEPTATSFQSQQSTN